VKKVSMKKEMVSHRIVLAAFSINKYTNVICYTDHHDSIYNNDIYFFITLSSLDLDNILSLHCDREYMSVPFLHYLN